ncbi:MAG: hypothetical protein IKI75_01335 [Lachnospiraceae bacterium]|nr:hypothetical protein [Lachnospiraceae bacterium]
MKKRILRVLTILACVSALTACGSKAGRESGSERSRYDSSKDNDKDDEPAEKESSGKKTSSSETVSEEGEDIPSGENFADDLAKEYDTVQETGSSGKPLFQYNREKYEEVLAEPDDPYDFCAASDYISTGSPDSSWGLTLTIHDACGYKTVFDFDKPSLADINKVIDDNPKIGKDYKEFFKDYAKSWLELWPDSDLSNLYYNLKTLKIEECTPEEIHAISLSFSTVACYVKADNKIYIREGIDLNDKNSDDYIVMSHELTHPARTLDIKDGKNKYHFTSYVYDLISYEGGSMYDEAVITNLIYEMQNEGKRSIYYTVPCSYYRIIMDCVGYDGNDYMNHSSNYIAKKMDEYMGDEYYAYYIMELIGYRFKEKNETYISVEIEDYSPLYEYITRMYMKKYLKPQMDAAEAEAVFEDFTDEMAWNIENLQYEYEEQDPDTFRPYFEQCCEELGIGI